MSAYYVDPSIAGNSGAGTIGDPYGDLQYALDTVTRNATTGDVFHIKAGTAEVLTAALSTTTYGTPTAAGHLHFRGYTSAAGDGGIGEISGAGTYSMIQDSKGYVHWTDMKLGNSGADEVIVPGTYCSFFNCELHTCANNYMVYLVGSGHFFNRCHFHTFTGSFAMIYNNVAGAKFKNNFFDSTAGIYTINSQTSASHTVIIGNVFKRTGNIVIYNQGNAALIANNSFMNNSNSTLDAIDSNNSNHVIVDNIFEGWSGFGGSPISSASNNVTVNNNLYYDNATNALTGSGAGSAIRNDGNVTATASPFTDASSDDYNPTSEASGINSVSDFLGAETTENNAEVGAAQLSGGGGGVVTTRYGHA